MRKSTRISPILFIIIWLFAVPVSLFGQQRVVVSPFYSDYATLTDSLPRGWSLSPYIQLGVKIDFSRETTLSSLKQYHFENSSYFSTVLRPFIPISLQYGHLKWDNLNLTNWNTLELEKQERQYVETAQEYFSLSYNDCSFIAGTLVNNRGIPSFSYIHYEGWGTLLPINTQKRDTTTYILHINPSLFYLLTDKGLVDLYTTEKIIIPPNEKYPSLFLFYKPIYEYKTIKYKGLNVKLLAENEMQATKLYRKLSLDTIGQPSNQCSPKVSVSTPDDSIIYRALSAIDSLTGFSKENQKHIAIVKTGLNFRASMGRSEDLDSLSANFSLKLDSVLLMDQEMFYQHTLLHEMLHFVIGNQQTYQKDISNQELNFFTESVTEYLAKYLFGKYIVHKNMFVDSIEHCPINLTMLKKAKRSIRANNSVSVGTKDSNEAANTAWVYYDLLPVLIHQLAASSQVDEKKFAQSIYYYVRRSDKQQQSLQHFFSYLKEQGFYLHSLQKNKILYLLNE